MNAETISQPNATTFTPEDLVAQVLAGRVRVPSFQRKFRWQWEDVRRLFDSISKGYPIGNLLFWERNAKKERIQIGSLGIDASEGTALFVVDGQQRVTSLVNALTEEGAQDARFGLVFDIKNEKFEKVDPKAGRHMVPLHVIFDLQKLLAWFADHRDELGQNKVWFERATRLTKAIRQYMIPAYVVKQQDEKVLRDIFDRMNNYGRRLGRAEVFSALHGGLAKDGSNVQFSAMADAVDAATGFGRLDDDTVLQAFLARRGAELNRDIRLEFDADRPLDFSEESAESAYRLAQQALERTIRFLQTEAFVPHFGFLPYRYLIVVLTRFFGHFPEPSSRNRSLLRRFFWRAAVAGPSVLHGWTSTMRMLAARITAGNESGSVQRLLDEFKDTTLVVPRLTRFRANTAETRILLCALFWLRPLSPIDGEPYDLDSICATLKDESRPTNVLRTFFPQARDPFRGWAANRAILLEDVEDTQAAFVEKARVLNARLFARILKSHALDKSMWNQLEIGDAEGFLNARQVVLVSLLRKFVEKVTETKFEDTPPLDELILDDDEEGGLRDDETDN